MIDIVNESFPTSGKVPKNLRIFHGSTKQGLKTIKPRKSYSYPELGPIVFGTFYKSFAACFCLQWDDNDLKQSSNNHDYNDMSLWLLHDMDFTKPCSIYELVNDGSFNVLYNNPAEIFSTNTIRVKKEEQFDSFADVLKLYNIDLYNFNTKQPLRTYSGLLDESTSIETNNIEVDLTLSEDDKKEMYKMNVSKTRYLIFKIYGESIEMTERAEHYRLNDELNLTPLITANISNLEELEERYSQYMSLSPKFKSRCNDKSMAIYGETVDSRYLKIKSILNKISKVEEPTKVELDEIEVTDTSINNTLHEHLKYIESIIESNNYTNRELATLLLDLNDPKNEFTFTESVIVKNFIKDKINILENGNDDRLRPYYSPDEMIKMGVFYEDANSNFYNVKSSQDNISWFLEYYLSDSIDFKNWYKKLLVEYNDLLKDPSNYNKQKILEMGWNPELEPSIENIVEASKSNKKKKIDNIDIRDIGDRLITAPDISKKEAILNGGFSDNDGIWNSIIEVDGYPNKLFRERVEVLILDDKGNVYLNKKGNKYRVPGGSTEKDIEDIIQVQNEAKEEARLCIKDVKNTGIHYVKLYDENYLKNAWFRHLPVVWDGQFTKVYIAKFDSIYSGKIRLQDQDLDMVNNGKFYPIDKVYNILRPEHKKAIDQYRVFNESSISNKLSINIFNEYKKSTTKLFPVFIVTVFTNSSIAHIIKKVTDCQYTHAGISLESKLDKIFSFNLHNGEGGGFNIESLKKYLDSNKDADMKLMCIFVNKDDLQKIKIALDNTIANIHNSSYSIINLIYILLNKAKAQKDDLSMVCSQFVDYILRSANINIIDKPNNLVTPADFAKSTNSKVYTVYEGKANKYDSKKIDNKIFKLNKSAKYINEYNISIDSDNEIDSILESYININLNLILERKTFPSVEFSKDGDLLIKNYKKIKFEEEYYKSTKLLKIYNKKNNYEAIAYELSKLWFMNNLLEQKIYSCDNKEKLDEYNLIRGKILNTFNRYLKIICENVEDFNFEEYYNNTPFSDTITIKKSTLNGIIDIAKRIIL